MADVTIARLQAELAKKDAALSALMEGFELHDLPTVSGLTFDVLYRPAGTLERLGGDWYDVFTLPDSRIAFTIGDVCGRGLAAAVKMGQAKQAIKVAASLRTNDPMPHSVLDQTNKVMFLNGHDVKFTTAIYGIIDLPKRHVTYASAGHHPPMLAKVGAPTSILPNHGFPLGVELELPDLIREHEFTFEPGTLLVLYTDGLIESSHDLELGEGKLLQAARDAVDAKAIHPAAFIAAKVLGDAPLYLDDVAVLTILFA
jgi:serine phosphatase RsbU (regulator of sigma subunit)